jgi:hypothetical protein
VAICSAAQNPPIPKGLRVLHESELTPAMQRWAKGYADDVSIPIGTAFRQWWGKLPVVAMVLCHTYTVIAGEQIPGLYHGVTLFVATDPAWYPDVEGDERETNWPLVGVCTLALGVVTGAFVWAIKKTGRAVEARRAAAERR